MKRLIVGLLLTGFALTGADPQPKPTDKDKLVIREAQVTYLQAEVKRLQAEVELQKATNKVSESMCSMAAQVTPIVPPGYQITSELEFKPLDLPKADNPGQPKSGLFKDRQ